MRSTRGRRRTDIGVHTDDSTEQEAPVCDRGVRAQGRLLRDLDGRGANHGIQLRAMRLR